MDTRGETALSQLQNNFKFCCLQELGFPRVWPKSSAESRVQKGELPTAASLIPINEEALLKSHFCALRHKITISLCPLKS